MTRWLRTLSICLLAAGAVVAASCFAADAMRAGGAPRQYGADIKIREAVNGSEDVIFATVLDTEDGTTARTAIGKATPGSTVFDGIKVTARPTTLPDGRVQVDYSVVVSDAVAAQRAQAPTVLAGTAIFDAGTPRQFARGPYTVTITLVPESWGYLAR